MATCIRALCIEVVLVGLILHVVQNVESTVDVVVTKFQLGNINFDTAALSVPAPNLHKYIPRIRAFVRKFTESH